MLNIGFVNFIYKAFLVSYVYGIYSTLNYSYSYLKIINLFNQKISRVSKFIKNTQEIFDKTQFKFGNIQELDFKNDCFIKHIQHNTFDLDSNSIVFTNKGMSLFLFKKIINNKDILLKYMEYLGKIDAWISVTDLYLNKDNGIWSIPSILNNKEKPEIVLEGFRNILVDGHTIENDIHIGGNSSNKNLMITGPNASGKSTFLKSITEWLIFAQTIGLVPCHSMNYTPFKEINTYLNIPDCQGKESLFQAEMERCFNQIQNIKKLDSNEFVFSIMDEIFVSTNYYEGISGAYAISEKMGRFNNSICLISTHFPTLSKFCEQKGCFTNYHFSIDECQNNSDKQNKVIIKTYKVKKGASKQHIALKMLKEKGFDKDIIKDANKMYKYLMTKQTNQKKKENHKPVNDKTVND